MSARAAVPLRPSVRRPANDNRPGAIPPVAGGRDDGLVASALVLIGAWAVAMGGYLWVVETGCSIAPR